jgi:formylglycine-generating enzyme required for sulfatase activity
MTLSIFNGSIGLFIKACLFFGLLMTEDVNAKRIALVMGNDNYTSVSKLQKAGNDATAMARELKNAGFTVQLHKDLNYRGIVRAVEAFTNNITGGDEVVVFFAGHGVQIRNGSYLLPTDIEANSESEVEKTAYELLALTDKISEAKPAFSLVMVDACRDNPLKSKGRNIGNARGLSAIEPPKGQMVVYSASRGQQALDRLSDKDPNPNGVFTREFITQMQKPGVRIEDIMRSVQDSVETLAKSVSHEQRPAVYNEARGNFYFFGPTAVQVAPPVVAELTTSQREDGFWNDAKAAGNKEAYEAYLESYPTGRYVNLAKANIARLTPPTLVAAAPSTAPIAVQTVPQISTSLSVGVVIKDCADCPEMVMIPAGQFVMGATSIEEEREKLPDSLRNRSQPTHQVNVSSFMAGRYEVTVGQYRAFALATNRSSAGGCFAWNGTKNENDLAKDWRNTGFPQNDSHPVACVSWEDSIAYVQWLRQKTGKDYRLLTEAEWEYSARAGTTTARFWGEDGNVSCSFANGADTKAKMIVHGASNWPVANCDDGYAYTAPVGSYKPNAFGLYDMLGNVWEWTQDCLNENYVGAPSDGSAWTKGDCSRRVLRGGSWDYYPQHLRSAFRARNAATNRGNFNGFRVAR